MNAQFLRTVNNAAKAAVRDVFKSVILPGARASSPKRTGANAASIGMRVRSSPSRVYASIWTDSGYGGFLERGTRRIPAHPYIYPSAQQGLGMLGEAVRMRLEAMATSGAVDIPDEVIAGMRAIGIKTKIAKGVGIIGARKRATTARGRR